MHFRAADGEITNQPMILPTGRHRNSDSSGAHDPNQCFSVVSKIWRNRCLLCNRGTQISKPATSFCEKFYAAQQPNRTA